MKLNAYIELSGMNESTMYLPYNGSDGFAMSDKVELCAPVISSIDDLSGWRAVVDRVSAHHELTVGRPAEAENVCGAGALLEGLLDTLLHCPVERLPDLQRLVIRLN